MSRRNLKFEIGILSNWNFALLLALQIFVFIIFRDYGHDNEEYLRLFYVADSSYLEPFWEFYSYLLNIFGFDSAEEHLYGMVLLLIGQSIYIYKLATKDHIGNYFSQVILLCLIISYEISFATGALRQGLSFLSICIFLLSRNLIFLIASIAFHWSGAVYALSSKYILAVVFFIFLILSTYYLNDFQYVNYFIQRSSGYLISETKIEIISIIGLTAVKVATFALFFRNFKFLLNTVRSRAFVVLILSAPIFQLIPITVFQNPVLIDRGNMLLDPLIYVGFIYITRKIDLINSFFLSILIIPKLLIRLYIAFL